MRQWFELNRPDYVYLVAGTVGASMQQKTAADHLRPLMLHATVVEACTAMEPKTSVLGSSCIYDGSTAPWRDYLLGGTLEPPTSLAVAKIAGQTCPASSRQ